MMFMLCKKKKGNSLQENELEKSFIKILEGILTCSKSNKETYNNEKQQC